MLAHGQYSPPVRRSEGDPRGRLLEIAKDYAAVRERELHVLRGLTPEQWEHRFDHPTIWGEVSMQWWPERLCQHTAEHLGSLWLLRQLTAVEPRRLAEAASRL